MKTTPRPPRATAKKRGPAKRLPPMVDTHIFLPDDLLEWGKYQPEGLAPLVRQLLAEERLRRQG